MVDIFISYSREDEARAQDLARRFEASGISAWWDRQIPPGKTWDQVIGKALEEARCVVVLWSRASIASDWVKEEASRGMRRGVLVPAVFDHVEPPLGFGRIEAAELSGWDGADHDPEFVNFLGAIQELVGRGGEAPAVPPAVRVTPLRGDRSWRRRALVLSGLVVLLAVSLGIVWWLGIEDTHRVDLQVWNVEGEDKGSVVASRTFSIAARGPLPTALVEEVGRWLVQTVASGEAAAAGEVTVQLSIPADFETGEVQLLASPPVGLDTYLYIVGDTGKVRVRSDLNSESLALLEGEFVVEIGAVGYSSVPVRVRKGESLERTVRLRPLPVKLAIEDVTGPENDIARRVTSALAQHAGIKVFGPEALARLREEIAESRAAIGVNRTAQIAIRDSLGVDYIMSGVYERK